MNTPRILSFISNEERQIYWFWFFIPIELVKHYTEGIIEILLDIFNKGLIDVDNVPK